MNLLDAWIRSRASASASSTKPYRRKPSAMSALSCGQMEPVW
jgi:hypothetical protein